MVGVRASGWSRRFGLPHDGQAVRDGSGNGLDLLVAWVEDGKLVLGPFFSNEDEWSEVDPNFWTRV